MYFSFQIRSPLKEYVEIEPQSCNHLTLVKFKVWEEENKYIHTVFNL